MFLKVERGRSIYWNQLLISKSSVAIIIKWEHLKQTNTFWDGGDVVRVYSHQLSSSLVPYILQITTHLQDTSKMSTASLKERIQVPSDNKWSLTSGETCQLWGYNSSFPRVLCRGKLDYQWPRKGEGYSDRALEKLKQRHDMQSLVKGLILKMLVSFKTPFRWKLKN